MEHFLLEGVLLGQNITMKKTRMEDNNHDWMSMYREGLRSVADINEFFQLNLPPIPYDVHIPKHLAIRIKEEGLDSVLAKQFIPSLQEVKNQCGGLEDPIGDQDHARPGALVHRYKNRVLFFPTTVCPVICRYCFRKNELSTNDNIFKSDFEKTKNYLREHPEIEEVIFSGGDPLMLSDEKINFYLSEFSRIPTIKYIRFHTRAVVSLPQRITDKLVDVLKNYQKMFSAVTVVIHTNHGDEITDAEEQAIKKLSGLNLLSQTVLLKDINSDTHELASLFSRLHQLGVRPYYLHHPDKVKGGMQFHMAKEEGKVIYNQLKQLLPGWLIPKYVIDSPTGKEQV
jgi:lysine 2,3-aminomutase